MAAIRTEFGFRSTAAQVLDGLDLTGVRVLITGASSGIGAETARSLHAVGADVTLAVRNVQAGRQVADRLAAASGRQVDVRGLELDRLESIRQLAAEWTGPLHVLINNAGIMATPELERTDAGMELQFATNYFGHFALLQFLFPALAAANGARVVNVSSSGHLLAPVVFDDMDFRFFRYDPLTAYGQSKTACVLMAVEASRQWGDKYGIWANALNPGAIPTNLQKHTGGLRTPEAKRKSVEQGAATSVLLAAHPAVHGVGGRYFEDCNEAARVVERPADFTGVAGYALHHGNAARLWKASQARLRSLVAGPGLFTRHAAQPRRHP